MSLNNKTILDYTVYGTASGNYDGSSLDFVSNGVQAADYYEGQGSIQTVNIRVTDFVGTIKIQASLNDTLESALWFDVEDFIADPARTGYYPISLVGNYVWIRVEVVDFTQGAIDSITLTY
jgi:hypothetical protein